VNETSAVKSAEPAVVPNNAAHDEILHGCVTGTNLVFNLANVKEHWAAH